MTGLSTVTAVATAVTALVGCYVAYLAYRGYRRNDSETMLVLSVGVVFIAVVPFLVSTVAAPLLALSDAQAILGATLSHTLGLVAIYRSFD
jgi:positive regulator of sigma E activity